MCLFRRKDNKIVNKLIIECYLKNKNHKFNILINFDRLSLLFGKCKHTNMHKTEPPLFIINSSTVIAKIKEITVPYLQFFSNMSPVNHRISTTYYPRIFALSK